VASVPAAMFLAAWTIHDAWQVEERGARLRNSVNSRRRSKLAD
jgi:hypothetical protein